MQVGNRSRPDNLFLCVVADQCPGQSYCDKSFPTIEKHNEHLKRAHSWLYWCEECLHKFNCSLPAGPLRLAREEHDNKECVGKPSRENQQLRTSTYIMTNDQYRRFRRWRKTHVSPRILTNGRREPLPKTSWRRIRETLFPGSDNAAMTRRSELTESRQTTEDILDILAHVGNRQSTVMPQLLFDAPVPGANAMQLAWPDTVTPSLPTEESQMSTIFSEETHFETHPSSRGWSHAGGDEQYHPYLVDHERLSTVDPALLQVPENPDGHQTPESMASVGVGEDNPDPQELLWFCGSSHN